MAYKVWIGWKSKIAFGLVKFACTIFPFLFATNIYSQKGNFYITPILGVQMPLSKVKVNNYTKGILQNNIIEADALYGIKFEKKLANESILFLSYQNGIAGFSINVDSKPCANYNGPVSYGGVAGGFNNKRITLGYQLGFKNKKKIETSNYYVKTRFVFGLAVDIKGGENDTSGSLRGFGGPNRCGEWHYLEEAPVAIRKPFSLALPFGINFELTKGQKRKVGLSLIYTQGLTTNTLFQVDYVTTTYRDVAILKSKGSGISLALYYPIALQKKKR